jgi:hypothetical protein
LLYVKPLSFSLQLTIYVADFVVAIGVGRPVGL